VHEGHAFALNGKVLPIVHEIEAPEGQQLATPAMTVEKIKVGALIW